MQQYHLDFHCSEFSFLSFTMRFYTLGSVKNLVRVCLIFFIGGEGCSLELLLHNQNTFRSAMIVRT